MELHVEKYRISNAPDGEDYPFRDENGVSYKSGKDLISSGILNFCGCGNEDAALNYVKNVLQLLSTDKSRQGIDKFFEGRDDIKYFTFYMLDHLGLEEHGVSTPGWLTDKGKEVLEDLQKIFPNE